MRAIMLTALLGGLLLAASPMARAASLFFFDCGDDGVMLINSIAGSGIGKGFTEAAPPDGKGSDRIRTVSIRCDTASLYCLREGLDPDWGAEQTHVFAFPKRLHAGQRYDVEGYAFRVGEFHRELSGRLSTEIAVVPMHGLSGPYILRVQDRRGLVGIRFESLAGWAGERREAERKIGVVDCTAKAEKPLLFEGVRLIEEERRQ